MEKLAIKLFGSSAFHSGSVFSKYLRRHSHVTVVQSYRMNKTLNLEIICLINLIPRNENIVKFWVHWQVYQIYTIFNRKIIW